MGRIGVKDGLPVFGQGKTFDIPELTITGTLGTNFCLIFECQ